MAKKLTKEERQELEARLALGRTLVTQCEAALAEDDKASKAAGAEAVSSTVRGLAARHGTAAGILAIRELGGTNMADVIHGRKLE